MTLAMRNYGLVLPKNYVSIEKDEMEYIDGGGTDWGFCGVITFSISRSVMIAAIGIGATAAAIVCLSAASITGGVAVTLISGIAALIASVIASGILKKDYYNLDYFCTGGQYVIIRAISGFDNSITLKVG